MKMFDFIITCLEKLQTLYESIDLSWWKSNTDYSYYLFIIAFLGGSFALTALRKEWK